MTFTSQLPAGPMPLIGITMTHATKLAPSAPITSAYSQYAPPRELRIRGPEQDAPHSSQNATFFVTGQGAGRSGSISGVVWVCGDRSGYDGWAGAGNAGWDFHSVLPPFQKSEDWEGDEREFGGAGAARSASQDLGNRNQRNSLKRLRQPKFHANFGRIFERLKFCLRFHALSQFAKMLWYSVVT